MHCRTRPSAHLRLKSGFRDSSCGSLPSASGGRGSPLRVAIVCPARRAGGARCCAITRPRFMMRVVAGWHWRHCIRTACRRSRCKRPALLWPLLSLRAGDLARLLHCVGDGSSCFRLDPLTGGAGGGAATRHRRAEAQTLKQLVDTVAQLSLAVKQLREAPPNKPPRKRGPGRRRAVVKPPALL